MLLTRPLAAQGIAAGLVALGVSAGAPDPRGASHRAGTQPSASSFHVEHTPATCLLAEKVSRVVACVVPRSQPAILRVVFRAEGGTTWYSSPLRSDVPCYSGVLPRPSRATLRVSYFIEAEGRGGEKARTPEHVVAVVADSAACPGRTAATAPPGQRATWDAPGGGPRVPPGFEGAAPPTTVASTATPPAAVVTAPTPAPPTRATPAPPAPPAPGPGPAAAAAAPKAGGHGHRTAALVIAGVAVAGGGAAVVASKSNDTTVAPPPTGSGLPPTGVSGVYVGTETINYAGGCMGTDDVVLNLQEAGGALSGVLTFTVRTCACCASGHGANPISGSLSGTSLQMATPIGFSYSGTFAGNHLAGGLAGPGGVTGTWSVDKR